jgi:hypothetical protein
MSERERAVVEAVVYAMRSGCFFPVPEPPPMAPVRVWIQWGALRHLHDAVAALGLEDGDEVVNSDARSSR